MNRSLRYSLLTALAGSALGLLPGCDVIDNPQPPRTAVSAGRRDSLALDSAENARGLFAQTPVQRVLVEDYTGHLCGNCPRAARKAAELVQQHGEDRVIVVGTHVGYYARLYGPNYLYDFRTSTGDELNNTYGVDNFGLPQGMVNRVVPANGTSPVVSDGTWAGIVSDELGHAPLAQLTITPLYTAATRQLRLKTHAKYLSASGKSYHLVINVLEDSIQQFQKDYSITDPANPDKDIPGYWHRHVLRAAPLGTFGEAHAANPTANQEVSTYLTYTLPADATWDPHHLLVVAYLLEDGTRRVVQVAEGHLHE